MFAAGAADRRRCNIAMADHGHGGRDMGIVTRQRRRTWESWDDTRLCAYCTCVLRNTCRGRMMCMSDMYHIRQLPKCRWTWFASFRSFRSWLCHSYQLTATFRKFGGYPAARGQVRTPSTAANPWWFDKSARIRSALHPSSAAKRQCSLCCKLKLSSGLSTHTSGPSLFPSPDNAIRCLPHVGHNPATRGAK